jgi:nicotinamide-nucleotide amidase
LSARITDIPGISAVFQGGVIAYDNRVKSGVLQVPVDALERQGAVSQPVAEAMASGVRALLSTDFALSTTGIAGPGGGSVEKPVGLVWMAIAGPQGVKSEKQIFSGNREQIRAQAIERSLQMLNAALIQSNSEY